jgi:hypothetical protein
MISIALYISRLKAASNYIICNNDEIERKNSFNINDKKRYKLFKKESI